MKKQLKQKILGLAWLVVIVTALAFHLWGGHSDLSAGCEVSLGARRVKGSGDVFTSIDYYLQELGYHADHKILMRQLLINLYPNLEENLKKLKEVSNPRQKVCLLGMFVRAMVDVSNDLPQFNLGRIFLKRKADCLGFVQLVYILGRTAGLDVEAILVPDAGFGHIANVIHTERGVIILDLANQGHPIGFYISPILNWKENYEEVNKECDVWIRKGGSKIDEPYKVVQRIDGRGIAAELLIRSGYEKGEAGFYEEELQYYKRAANLIRTLAYF